MSIQPSHLPASDIDFDALQICPVRWLHLYGKQNFAFGEERSDVTEETY
jgi:hypothetical protein